MRKGFALAAGRVGPDGDISTALHELSETLMNDVGGAMGPLYGVFFDGLATGCERQPFLTATTIEQMLERARDEVIAIGGARVGDKTLVDVLAPASDAFADRLREGASLQTALEDMAVAAEDHRDATRQMVARIGRAARAGERSGGRIDAGAASCAVILRSLSSSFQDRPTGHPTP